MSERDSVHKEIEKLQDEVQEAKKKVIMSDSRVKHYDEEVIKIFMKALLICKKYVRGFISCLKNGI